MNIIIASINTLMWVIQHPQHQQMQCEVWIYFYNNAPCANLSMMKRALIGICFVKVKYETSIASFFPPLNILLSYSNITKYILTCFPTNVEGRRESAK